MWKTFVKSNFYAFELFCLFRLASNSITGHATGMMTQDKICLVIYNQTDYFCQNIQHDWNTTVEQNMRDEVLAESSRFGNYKSMLEFIPMILWSLFVGSFLDSTVVGVFVIMAMQALSGLVLIGLNLMFYFNYHSSPYYMLLTSISVFFSGGMVSFVTTGYRYLSVRSEEAERAFKFLILEVVIVVGMAASIMLGGQLTRVTDSEPSSGPIRTYQYNFYVSLCLDVVCLLLIIFLYARDGARKVETSNKSTNDNAEESATSVASKMFNFENVRQTVKCFFKPRPHNIRMQVFILYACLFVAMLTTSGAGGVMMGFVQKVYHWSPTTSTTFTAIKQVVSMVLMGVISTILIKWLKVRDSYMIILSQASSLANDLVVGTFLTPVAYYISLPVGSLAWLGLTAIRSKMTKIIPEDEIGKVLSFSSTIDAIVPFVASVVYSNLFAVTIGPYPGAIYHFGAVLMALVIVGMGFEVFYCPVKSLADLKLDESDVEKQEAHQIHHKKQLTNQISISNDQNNQL